MGADDNQVGETPKEETKAEVGILFVHGLGPTNQGEQLSSSGEPLYNWLRSWLKGDTEETSENDPQHDPIWLDNTYLSRPQTDPCSAGAGTPAHATIFLKGPDKPRKTEKPEKEDYKYKWIMAESWWDADYPQSQYSQIWKWVLGVAPEIVHLTAHNITRQMVQIAERIASGQAADASNPTVTAGSAGKGPSSQKGAGPLAYLALVPATWLLSKFLFYVITPLIELLAQVVLVALAWLAFIPPIRNMVVGVQQGFATNWGDGWVIAHSPLSLEAMTTQVQNDIQWLKNEGCENIAVIAHSGGTAVSNYALATAQGVPDVDLFVTYGNAIQKLDLVRKRLKARGVMFAWRMVTRLLGVISFIAAFLMATVGQQDWWVWALGLAVAGIALSMIGTAFFGQEPNQEQLAYPVKSKVNQWLDFHAVADPAPHGPLKLPPGSDKDTLTPIDSILVSNLDSIPEDHSQYWFNNEQFVSHVARTLCTRIVAKASSKSDGSQAVSYLARLLNDPHSNNNRDAVKEAERAAGRDGIDPCILDAFDVASKKRDIRAFLLMMSGYVSMAATVILWLGLSPYLYDLGKFLATPLLSLFSAHVGDTSTDLISVVLGMVIIAAGVALFNSIVLFTFWREWSNSETQMMYQVGTKKKVEETGNASALSFLVGSLVPPLAGLLSVIARVAADGNGPKEAWQQALAWYLNSVPAPKDVLARYAGFTSTVDNLLPWVAGAILLYGIVLALFGTWQVTQGPKFPTAVYGSEEVTAPAETATPA